MTALSLRAAAVAVLAYLLGSMSGAIIVSRLFCGRDVREMGSGNAGLTNFYRCFGAKWMLPVLLIDLGKGMAAVWCGEKIFAAAGGPALGQALGMLFVILGHMYPVFFHFRGGKGVLTGVGALFMLDWRLALLQLGLFFLVLLLSRYVSLASVLAAGTMPLAAWLRGHETLMLVFLALCAGMVVYLHRGNISRLLRGCERKFEINKH